jgi:hypothetical protein
MKKSALGRCAEWTMHYRRRHAMKKSVFGEGAEWLYALLQLLCIETFSYCKVFNFIILFFDIYETLTLWNSYVM